MSKKIIELLLKNSNLTIHDISRHLRISTRAVEKQIHSLKEAGQLKRKGGRKTGWWEVKEK
jgi:ATP-dependent DNA helicase RecG